MLFYSLCRYVPGWDTHGLPIELKVLQGLPSEERKALDTITLRAKAKEYALKTMDSQRQQFKRWVVGGGGGRGGRGRG
jgi:isoleucyl-tRNA synthetase